MTSYIIQFMDTNLKLSEGKVYVIGRSVRSDIALPHGSVSRKHAVIEWMGDGFILRDLQSTNGTFLNNTRITEARLNRGDRIRTGEFELTFEIGDFNEENENAMPLMQTMQMGLSYAELVRQEGLDAEAEKLTRKMERDSAGGAAASDGIDPLTGLYDRAYFDGVIGDEVQISREFDQDLALLMLDVDNLQQFNASEGQAKGDAVLQAIGRVLQKFARSNDIAVRYGGDKFALLSADTAPDAAASLAENILREVAQSAGVAASVGVANFGAGISSAGQLTLAAENALKRAKANGGNQVGLM